MSFNLGLWLCSIAPCENKVATCLMDSGFLRSARAAKIAATASLRGMVLAKKSYDLTKDSMDIARVSAKAASVSALASDKSAESLINSERAWIMAELVFSADLPAPAPTKSRIVYGDSSDGRHTIAIDVCLICRNDGRTPAWISCTRIHFRNLLGHSG